MNKIGNLTDDVIIDWTINNIRSIDWLYTQIHCIKGGIRNIIYWLPVIYNDRWWDHLYLYVILKHKFSQMERGFREDGHSTTSKKDAKNIKKCILLLDRLINDDYIEYKENYNIRESFNKEKQMINQDLDLLFKTMRKQIRSWWD